MKNENEILNLDKIIFLMGRKIDENDKQIDLDFPQWNNMYWLNPQQHIVLHLLSLDSECSNLWGRNRGTNAFVWIWWHIKNGKNRNIKIDDLKDDILPYKNDKYGAIRYVKENIRDDTLPDNKETVDSYVLVKYILHYLSLNQNYIPFKKSSKQMTNIVNNFCSIYQTCNMLKRLDVNEKKKLQDEYEFINQYGCLNIYCKQNEYLQMAINKLEKIIYEDKK